ncbi:hypothetical protein MMC13_006038 [Lambiella insularis]|nr:hypothetical protein [Lambiella insularis]
MNTSTDPFPPSLPRLDSPPLYDTEMLGPEQNGDLYFNSALSNDSPGRFLNDDVFATSPFQSPAPRRVPHTLSTASKTQTAKKISASPESSLQDSSSDSSGRHKRKTSSKSSLSGLAAHEQVMPGTRPAEWKSGEMMDMAPEPTFEFPDTALSKYDSYDFSNRAMEHDFDFESAASSPSPVISAATPVHRTTRHIAIPYRASPRSAASLVPHICGSPGRDNREISPLSATANPELDPSKLQQSRASPASSNEEYIGGAMVNGMEQLSTWPYDGQPSSNGVFGITQSSNIQGNLASGPAAFPSALGRSQNEAAMSPVLVIHPTPHKSRVETQIPIKMTLCPMPPHIKKLHLPPHTISKPKLLAKDPLPRAPDMLELYTMLVCTSAMQDPTKMRRAFSRAAQGSTEIKKPTPRRSSSGDTVSILDEEDQPLNGGPVHICEGCILRERKRAARKKSKKPEEEEPWQKDETKRIIVFNTSEVKDWQTPSDPNEAKETVEAAQQSVFTPPDCARQIDVPMRIACYCRHQNEKLGFQVIFTLKDHDDNLVAQAITNPIVITDDHKTHAPPASLPAPGPMFLEQSVVPSGTLPNRDPIENYGAQLYRNAHSTTDLQNLQHNYHPHFMPQPISPYAVPQSSSHTTSTSLTPRNLSRQASPSAQLGRTHKKRKASGSGKIPDGLTMTRLQTTSGPSVPNQSWTTAASSNPASPAIIPPYASSFSTFNNTYERPYTSGSSSRQTHVNTGPPTPNSSEQGFFSPNRSQSFENISAVQQMFSTPNSARASRAASPVSTHQLPTDMPPGQAPPLPHAVMGLANGTGPQRQPIIHKLIPSEGSKAGGIEVTCLGSGFRQGLEVMFGNSLATTTTYWGETSLVCLLPPAIRAGTVAVTFKHQHQRQIQHERYTSPPMPKHQVFFKYVDDDDQELVRHALLLVHQKMTGTIEDVGEIARRIINAQPHGAGPWSRGGSSGGDQGHRVSGIPPCLANTIGTENAVLKCIDLIDLDDSPFQASLNLRRPNGQSMLHLGASLGYHRLVAGLLARGANPDLRDKNGMSPMHMAALHGHPNIIRRLRLAGGDPNLRSLRGYTPADMASAQPVLYAVQALQSHSRSRSAGARTVPLPSQASSTTSLRSLWKPHPGVPSSNPDDSSADESDDQAVGEGALSGSSAHHVVTPAHLWSRSRRNSTAVEQHVAIEESPQQLVENNGLLFPAVAMAAWRDQLAAQIQHFHQSVHWTLPNLQLPNLPPMPTLPDYRADAMVRRFSSLVPQRSFRPNTSSGGTPDAKESDYKWWELLTGTASSPPPYEEIYPASTQEAFDIKTTSAACAATDALADQKYNQEMGQASSPSFADVTFIEHDAQTSQQEQMKAHARRVKRLRSDRNLFFIWASATLLRSLMSAADILQIPLLVFVVIAMLMDRVPPVWRGAQQVLAFAQNCYQGQIMEVL